MAYTDSIDKIVTAYFAAVTAEPFTYKGKTFHPKELRVSLGVLRGFKCPSGCAGCCPRFSLDYLPFEEFPDSLNLIERKILFNEREILIKSDIQSDHKNHHCRNVITDPGELYGRCGIHGKQPFSCDFELIRFSITSGPVPNRVNQALFSRGWNMLRVDGERGALCSMTEPDLDTIKDTVRRFKRLKQWVEYFGIKHKLDEVISWVETGPYYNPLIV